jgi:hypothetical protein
LTAPSLAYLPLYYRMRIRWLPRTEMKQENWNQIRVYHPSSLSLHGGAKIRRDLRTTEVFDWNFPLYLIFWAEILVPHIRCHGQCGMYVIWTHSLEATIPSLCPSEFPPSVNVPFITNSDPLVNDPLTVQDAKSGTDWPHWQKAMDEEMTQLRTLGTFTLESLPAARFANGYSALSVMITAIFRAMVPLT